MILDTNSLSAWADGNDDVLSILPEAQALPLPVIVVGEYLWGLRKSRYRGSLSTWLDSVIASIRLLPVNLDTAHAYAVIREIVQMKGRPIPANDAWIAALALQHDLPVLSRDAHFDLVHPVRRIAW